MYGRWNRVSSTPTFRWNRNCILFCPTLSNTHLRTLLRDAGTAAPKNHRPRSPADSDPALVGFVCFLEWVCGAGAEAGFHRLISNPATLALGMQRPLTGAFLVWGADRIHDIEYRLAPVPKRAD